MYQCYSCGAVFDEPVRDEWYEYMGYGIYEPMSSMTCPECGGDEYDDYEDYEEV